jgi:acyl-CoA synthetase (AMP-forming)/AMP-acid ligase II
MTTPRDLYDIFENVAGRSPDRLLVRSCGGGRALNAAALLDEVRTTASGLGDDGLGAGDLAIVAGAAGTPFMVGTLAVWARDAVVLAADPQVSGPELQELRATFGPRIVVTQGTRGDMRSGGIAGPAGASTPPLPPGAAVVKLTSGSTGKPRGIAVTAGQLLADARHIIEGMGVGRDDVNIGAIPLSHSYGMDSLLMPLVIQGTPLLLVPAALPELLAEALSIDEPAIFPGVPYLFEMLARPGGPAFARRGLRTCLSAGAPLRARTAAAFSERFGLPIRSFYGTSETGGITYDASPEGDCAALGEGCVGTPLPGVEVSLEGEESRVVVRGANVGAGYIGPVDEGADGGFRDGLFMTGDTGRFDDRGRLHLTGRITGLVNVSGRKVNPREIERTLTAVDGVGDAAVLSVSDESRGESLVACIVAQEGVTREHVMAHLRASLAPYKIPRRLVFLAELPRNARGKLDVKGLRLRAGDD